MAELAQGRPSPRNFSRSLGRWADRRLVWLSKHWLAGVNTFFFLYVGLPFLAPVLLANGYYGAANIIYSLYRVTCHQLPSRAYFIFGEQVALCHRDIAIYATLLAGGLLFNFVRSWLKPPPFRWYVFFLVPIGLDAGMAMASELLQFTTMTTLWVIGLAAMGITGVVLHRQKYLTWHGFLFLAFGPLALLYLQFFGPHQSNVFLRNVTGFIFGLGTVWYAFPYLEESFNDIHQELRARAHG